MKCPVCYEVIDDDSIICTRCGSEQSGMISIEEQNRHADISAQWKERFLSIAVFCGFLLGLNLLLLAFGSPSWLISVFNIVIPTFACAGCIFLLVYDKR